jgi:UPF0755 protein
MAGLALVVVAVLAGVGLAVAFGVHRLSHLFGGPADYPGEGFGRAVVVIHPGETATQIGSTLQADGVVASAAAFIDAANADPRSRLLAPGYYALHRHMKAMLALDALLNPVSRTGGVVIPEGFTAAQAEARIAAVTHTSLAALRSAAADPPALGVPAWAPGHSIEGFLWPATYDFAPGESARAMLSAMVAQFTATTRTLDLAGQARRLGYTPYQVLTLASIVQDEGVLPATLPKIARVFYNRLSAGMPLGSDATLYYVVGHHGALTAADLRLNSPYNTRIRTGFPPTPIDNPGRLALLAVLHPATGTWLYFTTMDHKGDTRFETTYAQHEVDAAIAARRGLNY